MNRKEGKTITKNTKTSQKLQTEVEDLRRRLEDAEETLRAIRNNEVDALVIDGPQGQQVFTLQGAEWPYRTLMETMSEGALTITMDGTILFCNSHLSDLFKIPLNKIIGASFHDFVRQDNGQSLEALLGTCGREGCREEFFFENSDGKNVPVSLSVRELMLDDLKAFCIVATDLTDQKRIQHTLEEDRDRFEEKVAERTSELLLANATLEKEIIEHKLTENALQKAQDELESRIQERTFELSEAYETLQREVEERKKAEEQLIQVQKQEALGTLAGGIAHDFNNILAGIIGFTEMVMEDLTPDRPEQKKLELVLKSAHRGRDLVQQILIFSRQDKPDRKPLDLNQTVKQGLKILRPALPSVIEITSKCSTDDEMVLADPVQMQQVLMNLVTNASHAMREKGGILHIGISDTALTGENHLSPDITPGEYVILEVVDTGVGMTPEILQRIFDPFFTTKMQGEGTGLGLSVVHGIVRSHGGNIIVKSELGKGTIFHVYFPKIKERVSPEDKVTPTGTGGKERILIVDDEEILVELNEQRLSKLGYEIVATTSAMDALDIFREEPDAFDLVVTDQTMPNLTGMGLAAELLKIKATIPIILCTGHSEIVSPGMANEAGIKAFLMKPLTKEELARTIRRVLDANREGGI